MQRNKLRMKRKKLKKLPKINFTPLVDLNMLLIVFFMFCNTISKPNFIEIDMPITNYSVPFFYDHWHRGSIPTVLIPAANNRIYWYVGVPQYEDYTTLKEIGYDELRPLLLNRFSRYLEKKKILYTKLEKKTISQEEYDEETLYNKNDYGYNPILIKPTEDTTYENLIDILDEIYICTIPRFAVLDLGDAEEYLIENYKTKGAYGENY